MGVAGARSQDDAVKRDTCGLIERELGPFDEVGKVGLVEREQLPAACLPWQVGQDDRRDLEKRVCQGLEQLDAPMIVGIAGGDGAQGSCR